MAILSAGFLLSDNSLNNSYRSTVGITKLQLSRLQL
jgi:hypothetical protein